MKTILLRPANLFLVGLMLSLIMLAEAYWVLPPGPGAGGWVVLPPLPAWRELPDVMFEFDHSRFVELIGPYVCGYWIVLSIIYLVFGRSKSIAVKNVSAFIHFGCAIIGVFMIVILTPVQPGRVDTYISFSADNLLTAEKLEWYQDFIFFKEVINSFWAKLGTIFIVAGLIIGFTGIKKLPHSADPS